MPSSLGSTYQMGIDWMHFRLGRYRATRGSRFASSILALILLVLVMLAFLMLPSATQGAGFESGLSNVVASLTGLDGTRASPSCCRI
ncbi:MAG: hypothetical protein WD942_09375 [Dehalococcoidia bacterium]